MNEHESVFTAPITIVDPAAFPQRRKNLAVWPAFAIALLTVATICLASYSLALVGEVHQQRDQIHRLQTQVSTLHEQIVHSR